MDKSNVVPYSDSTIAYFLDTEKKPALSINSGELVVFETMNAFSQETDTQEQLNEVISSGFHHPFTGPVYINGVQVGQTIEVLINDIHLADYGYTCISRSSGVLKGRFTNRNYKKIKIEGNYCLFEGNKLRINPSVGGVGLADPNMTRNGATSKHGGNLDIRWANKGARIFLPVGVQGGLLYMGDLHARQGNGEISGIALEVSGKVEAIVSTHNISIPCPIMQTNGGILIFGYGETFDQSVQVATEHSIQILGEYLVISPEDSYMLLSLSSDIIIGHLTGRIKSVAIFIPDEVLNIEVILNGVTA
ncbi:acetamidase/formamidase family protein [Paenibacillus polymyxa]|uniref:acetamidase/formamidase family protein n=1 Tax=Paenibacillus polymyxa TaxID=1406 RepID=UPI00307FB76F